MALAAVITRQILLPCMIHHNIYWILSASQIVLVSSIIDATLAETFTLTGM